MKEITKLLTLSIITFLAVSFTAVAQDCPYKDKTIKEASSGSDDPVGTKVDGGMLYGKSSEQPAEALSYSELIGKMEAVNGQAVTVKGKVHEVCQAMGCWMTMTENGMTTRVKTGHEFFLPKDVSGKDAVVTGVFKITEISEADARHYNDESPNPTIKSEDIIGPQKAFQIDATGIVILD